jgi:predicted nucleotidyltransferase component of viral defense system
MLQQWLDSYHPKSIEDSRNALREMMQEIALAGLYRAGFYKHAAFYGGTALRIFYGLPRFSEDMDFSLLEKNESFQLAPYLDAVLEEFQSLGLKVSITEKEKSIETNINSAFLKSDTIWKEIQLEAVYPQLHLGSLPSIKIKLEVDTLPPLGFETENKLLIKPFSFYVHCFTLPSLFAGKMHALLFRKWKNRVKGRDWFDFEWYVKNGVPLSLSHFEQRVIDSGSITASSITKEEVIALLYQKIDSLDFKRVKEDLFRFISKDSHAMELWSPQYFKDLVGMMQWS